MDNMKVRDLMVSIDQFPKISHSAKFFDAVIALEDAQEKYLSGESSQRILVVENDQGRIIGKISPIDLLRGLETNYNKVDTQKLLSRFGVSYVWESVQNEYQLWGNPFADLCRKARDVQVKDIVRETSEGQSVNADDNLVKCFHQFVMNRHDALFVFENDQIIGLLRFSDVYKKASMTMKQCGIENT